MSMTTLGRFCCCDSNAKLLAFGPTHLLGVSEINLIGYVQAVEQRPSIVTTFDDGFACLSCRRPREQFTGKYPPDTLRWSGGSGMWGRQTANDVVDNFGRWLKKITHDFVCATDILEGV
jgi:hypothetical protein